MSKFVDVSQYRNLVSNVKDSLTLKPNITSEEKSVIKELLLLITNIIEYDIVYKSIENNEMLHEIENNLSSKLESIRKAKENIRNSNLEMVNKNKLTVHLGIYEKKLRDMYETIKNKDFEFFKDATEKQNANMNVLIAKCNQALKDSGYASFFEKDLVVDGEINSEVINEVYNDVYTNPSLINELKRYMANEEKGVEVKEEKRTSLYLMEDILSDCEKNIALLIEYMLIRPKTGIVATNKNIENRDILSRAKAELVSLEVGGISAITHKKRKQKLEDLVSTTQNKINEYNKMVARKKEIEEQLAKTNVSLVVESIKELDGKNMGYEDAFNFNKKEASSKLSLYDRVAIILKTDLRKSSSLINNTKITIEKEIDRLSEDIGDSLAKNSDIISNLSSYAKDLAIKYKNDIPKLLNLRKETGDTIDPGMAIMILKIISDAKNIDYRKLAELSRINMGIDELEESYSKTVSGTANQYAEAYDQTILEMIEDLEKTNHPYTQIEDEDKPSIKIA